MVPNNKILFASGVFVLAVAQAAAAQEGSGNATPVEVTKPATKTMVRNLQLPATLIPDERVDLFAKTSGYVEAISVDIGSVVQAGQELVRLSVPEMMDELRQAEALLLASQARARAVDAKAAQAARHVDTAKAEVERHAAQFELEKLNLKRKEELRSANAVPEQALDEARSAHRIAAAQLEIAQAKIAAAEAERQAVDADVEVARAQIDVGRADVARLKTMIQYATVRAPFSGVITERRVDHGAFVRSAEKGMAQPLLTIAKTQKLRLVLQIPEVDAPFVRVGSQASVTVAALPGHAVESTIVRLSGALNPESRTMRAEIDLDNRDGKLAPGMYAKVVLLLETKSQALMVPSKSIRGGKAGSAVLVAANGIAQERAVRLGYDDGIWVEVLDGLDGSEDVITAAGGAITSGSAVQPVKSES